MHYLFTQLQKGKVKGLASLMSFPNYSLQIILHPKWNDDLKKQFLVK